MKPSEADVREMLQRRAREVVAAPLAPDVIVRRGSRRRIRNAVLASATALAVIALLAGSANSLRGSERGAGSAAATQSTAEDATSPKSGPLRLVDYTLRTPREHAHSQIGPTITVDEVRRHASCMRSEGFDIPAPTAQPGGGWSVIVDEADRRGLTFRSRAFRQAWAVTCGPLGGPLSGDMVIGGPRPKVDRFRACMSRRGFDLPEPTRNRSGYGIDEWRFDLTGTDIDTSTRGWNQAMFVDCAPQDQ